MKILFINASQNQHGHTAKLAKTLIGDHDYSTVNLIDQNVKELGQEGSQNDDFKLICHQVDQADVIVLGTPVYCVDMSGLLKIFIDRMSGILLSRGHNPFLHKRLYLVVSYQVNPEAVKTITYVVKTECHDMQIDFQDTISNVNDAKRLSL